MTFVSYSQNFEDVMLWRAFKHLPSGFYIDVGAAHPDDDSVTRAFYDRGWSGINIEPEPEFFSKLEAARPRDINIQCAVGASDGEMILFVVPGTGLSTLSADLAAQHRTQYDVNERRVPLRRLIDITRARAPENVHFLKVDVEGSEADVLRGAELRTFRPWLILVEATAPNTQIPTHMTFEPALVADGYEFLYFDGLNRFYAAAERAAELKPHFETPPGYFDDFVRSAEIGLAARMSAAESEAGHLQERCRQESEARIGVEARLRDTALRLRQAEHLATAAEWRARESERRATADAERIARAEENVASTTALAAHWKEALHDARARMEAVEAELATLKRSPLRKATGWFQSRADDRRAVPLEPARSFRSWPERRTGGDLSDPAGAEHSATLAAAWNSDPMPTPQIRRTGIRVVHQFHAGSAVGDAITNAMFLIQRELRRLGYRSEIFSAHPDPSLGAALRHSSELPERDDYILLLHLSAGNAENDRVAELPCPKVLIYHNITPPAFFVSDPGMQDALVLGRRQLQTLKPRLAGALADSALNALELRAAGFEEAEVATLLFDLDQLRRRFGARKPTDLARPFTILFVGRVVPSKGQLDLVEAFGLFRAQYGKPTRLVLAGRADGAGAEYAARIMERVRALGLEAAVELTGLISDEALSALYAESDLYVSLSRHEGFGVTLVEAAVAGLPVIALDAGAVVSTLGANRGVLTQASVDDVADRMIALARDEGARASLAAEQHAGLERFSLERHLPVLEAALMRAGAAAPRRADWDEMVASHLRWTVAGHVHGSYSLASVNRSLVRAIDAERPGRVRLIPVEGAPLDAIDNASDLAPLVGPDLHAAGPNILLSQHYPLFVPDEADGIPIAYLFWEETRLPSETVALLNKHFRAVLTPSRFVAKSVIDSGTAIPVLSVGFAPELSNTGLRRQRAQDAPFTFLHISSGFPRKGIDALLIAYTATFRADDRVKLILKTFPNPHNATGVEIAAVRAENPDCPDIEWIDQDLDPAALSALYARADAVVLPTRGEGFNLPAAEAMAAGIPLIVTGFGGHMDFCSRDVARLIEYRPAASRSHLATPGSLWVEPDVVDLAAALREAVVNEEEAIARAELGRMLCAERLSRPIFIRRLEQAARHILLEPRTRTPRLAIVSSWRTRCGVAEYTANLLGGLHFGAPDLPITVIADRRTEPQGARHGSVPHRTGWALGSADAATTLQAAIRSEAPDIVFVQHQPGLLDWPALAATIDATSVDSIVVVTLHNTAHLLSLDEHLRRTILESLGRASRVIVHTLADIERLVTLGLGEVAVLIPHGVSGALPPAPNRRLSPDQVVTIGSTGFLLPGKGVPVLVEAASLLRRRWPHLQLRLTNADYGSADSKMELESAREIIERTGMAGATSLVTDFLTFDDARWRLSKCDIVVLPYQRSEEGSSAALRSALVAGSCVAVTPLALFDEAEGAVFRFSGVDAAAIAEGLDRLLRNADLRTTITSAAQHWMAERSWQKIGTQTINMLRGLNASR